MKSLRPQIFAIWLALAVSSVVSVLIFLFNHFLIAETWHLIFLFFVIFVVVTIIASYFFRNVIENRLKPIFKIIRDVPVKEVQKAKEWNRLNPMNFDVNTEVTKWATHKQDEIKRLKELERYRKEFVGNVSHELKTPIFNIQGYILTLVDGGIDDARINLLYLKRTVKSIDRMISIVEDLESINKLESGELKLIMESFNLVKLVEDVFEIDHMIAKERKIKLKFINKNDNPVMVYADKKRIMEVMSNLVVNGIKYGKKSGSVVVSFYDLNDLVMIEVKDDGIGVDKDQLPRIFERFYRVDKHRSREQGGTGLGLAIVKHIIEAHKQTINVKSQVDFGTTFNFTLHKAKN
ncbi:MAG: ATP-binding protein [Prolixibacteraceae bacterium]|jgi:two-component system phosphate regulon sensor histidine kinase PhoR|nr:ATP-binding protein [Prolixibacteraceae bacterium]